MTTMGEILKIFRILQEEKISTSKLSQLIGYSQPYITQIERNIRKPTDEFLEKNSELYKVPQKEFYRILNIANRRNYNNPRLYLEIAKTIIKYEKEGK